MRANQGPARAPWGGGAVDEGIKEGGGHRGTDSPSPQPPTDPSCHFPVRPHCPRSDPLSSQTTGAGVGGEGLASVAQPSRPVSHRDKGRLRGLSPSRAWSVPVSIRICPALGTRRPQEAGGLLSLLLSRALAQPSLPKPHPCLQHPL